MILTLGAVAALGFVAALWLVSYRADRLAAIVGFIVVTAYVLVPTFYLGDLTVLRTAVMVTTLGATVILALRRRMQPGRSRGAWLFVAYFAVILFSTLLNPSMANINLWANAATPAVALTFVGLVATRAEQRIISRSIVILAVLQSLYAVAEVLRITPRLWGNTVVYPHQLVAGLNRAEGTLGHPLMLALLLLFALALTLSRFATSRRALRLVTQAVLVAGLFATGSRSALIVGVAMLLFSLGRRPFQRIVLGTLSGVLAVVALAASDFFEGSLVTSFISGASVTHRTGALDAVPGLLSTQSPLHVILGNGFYSAGSLFDAGLLQQGNFRAVDNQLVVSLVEGGLISLALITVVSITALRRGTGMRMPLLALAFFFFTFDTLEWATAAGLFGLAVAFAMNRPTADAPSEAVAPEVSRPSRRRPATVV